MLVGARLGPDSPHREFAFLFTQSEAGGGFSALSPEVTWSDVHVSECTSLRVGCGEAERAASETMDKSQGKRLDPSCCLDDETGGSLIKREFCHPLLLQSIFPSMGGRG